MTTATADGLKILLKKKDEIEAEIKALGETLETQQGVGMEAALVDDEQYPRSDIDVYSVRHTRHRINCLQNDHKALMTDIEAGLHQLHAETKVQKDLQDMEVDQQAVAPPTSVPFSVVTHIEPGSPAFAAGLHVGDLVVQFGSITAANFKDMKNIASVVQHSIGATVQLTVQRSDSEVRLALTPQTWAGRGLLGCNIEVYKKEPNS